MEDFPEILSIKALLLTTLEKVDAIEKKMMKKPLKRTQNRQQRVDILLSKKLAMLERNQQKRQHEPH